MSLEFLPTNALLLVLQFMGTWRQIDKAIMAISHVDSKWRKRFAVDDAGLWLVLATECGVQLRHTRPAGHYGVSSGRSSSSSSGRHSLRSMTNHKREFFRALYARQQAMNERHDALILQAKRLLQQPLDQLMKLKKLLSTKFPDLNEFDCNWRAGTLEDYSLLTLACRYSKSKCIKFIVEQFPHCDVNIADMGGFTPFILCAYYGNFPMIHYFLRHNADFLRRGSLRSGRPLIAEHWAAIQGHFKIFRYLHAMRVRRWHPPTASQELAPTEGVLIEDVDLIDDKESHVGDAEEGIITEQSFCLCKQTSVEPMIRCDGAACAFEWFHYSCVGLHAKPLGKWFCPTCMPYPIVHSTSNSTGHIMATPVDTTFHCVCGNRSDGKMIACENPNCLVEWFHFECVGIDVAPTDIWICPICSEQRLKQPLHLTSELQQGIVQSPHRKRRRSEKRRQAAEQGPQTPQSELSPVRRRRAANAIISPQRTPDTK